MHCIFIYYLNLDMYVIIYVNCQVYHYESVHHVHDFTC